MSQENVDKTRDFIDAYNRRDFEAATRDFDRDVEWVLPEHQRADSAIGSRASSGSGRDSTRRSTSSQLRPQEFVDAAIGWPPGCAISRAGGAAASSSTTSCTTRSRPSATA